MAIQFTNIKEDLFSRGIDAYSAENQVSEGFLRDGLNVDITQKHARKRTGHSGFAGNIPVRVSSVAYDNANNEICFSLDGGIDLLSVRSSPIIVSGRLSANIGTQPFVSTEDRSKYYPGFFQKTRQTFLTGTNTLVVSGATHGLGTSDLYVEVSSSNSPSNLSNELVDWDILSIDSVTNDITIQYTNNTGSDIPVFTYYLDKTPVTGSVYKGAGAAATITIPASTTQTFTISAAQHQLSSFNIIPRIYSVSGSTIQMIQPDSVTLNVATGLVSIAVTNSSLSSVVLYALLSTAPTQNNKTGVLSGSTYTITIEEPDTPFIFPAVYLSDNTNVRELVEPDSIVYDSVENTIEVTFQTFGAPAFNIIWDYGTITSTQLCVTDATLTADGTDAAPQLTLWGLDHTEIYGGNTDQRQGWANHIDSYRTSSERRVIAGQGGSLYSARTFNESGLDYLYGSLYPSLFSRISTAVTVAPLFWDTGELPGRSRGYITGTDLGDNWATSSTVAWDSVEEAVRYYIDIPLLAMKTASGGVETNILNIVGTDDSLTVRGMSYARHNGTFRIHKVQVSGTELSVWVQNPLVDSADWNDSGNAGLVGVFTDKLTFSSDTPFLPGDLLLSDSIPASLQFSWLRDTTGSTVSGIISGVSTILQIQTGVQITATRTGSVIPLRDALDSSTVENILRGDIVTQSETGLPLRVISVNSGASQAVSIVSDGFRATVTITDTSNLRDGALIILLHAGVYTGQVSIEAIVSGTVFTFLTEETASATGTLLGNTIEVGEPVEWTDLSSDTNSIDVTHRMIPVEAPLDSYQLPIKTYRHHFLADTFVNQSFLRSTMVQDSLFLTNGQDEVMKYDGTNIYKAGLINWQPGAFITPDTSVPPISPAQIRSVTATAVNAAARNIKVALADKDTFITGDQVKFANSDNIYTINRAVETVTPEYFYYFDPGPTLPAAAVVSEVFTYRYYYRMDAVDANNNIVRSAIAQSQDYVIQVTAASGVRHKIIGLPEWGNLDYDRIIVQAYRTLAGTSSSYYRVFQTRIPFNKYDGYIEFTDSVPDANLISGSDPANLLKAGELGIGWDTLPRSKFLTSAGGSLVQANLRGYPECDIQLVDEAVVATNASFLGDTLLLRRDVTDVGTLTNMVDRATYEWVDSTNSVAVLPAAFNGTAGVSVTISTALSVAVGNWVYLYYSTLSGTNRPLTYCGWFQVASINAGVSFTIRTSAATAGVPTYAPDRIAYATIKSNIPVLLGTDGNFSQVNGNSSVVLFSAARRMSVAINATMRVTDVDIAGQSEFRPWVIARGGSDTGTAGRLIIRQPRSATETFGITWTGAGYSVFINNNQRASGILVSSSTIRMPSRLLINYPNFPEITDSPFAELDSQSDSAVDINPADGQEISGILPFFGEAAFGAAQQSGVVVVFKETSIYLVDVNEKRRGGNPVQRIETEGIGCTASNSIAVTKGGIMFANESGIYVLRRDMSVSFVGKFMDRNWKRVDRSQLDLVQGHHSTLNRQYKASVTLLDGSNETFVYDHTNEMELGGTGAWTRYDGHPATGWCNLGQDSFFCTSTGRVMVLRRRGDKWDFQDDHTATNMVLQTRCSDLGVSASRKVLRGITIFYRTGIASTNQVGLSIDTEQEYDTTTPAIISKPSVSTGTSDTIGRDVDTVQHSMSRRKGIQFSFQVSNANRLEGPEIAGIDIEAGSLSAGAGLKQAADTK